MRKLLLILLLLFSVHGAWGDFHYKHDEDLIEGVFMYCIPDGGTDKDKFFYTLDIGNKIAMLNARIIGEVFNHPNKFVWKAEGEWLKDINEFMIKKGMASIKLEEFEVDKTTLNYKQSVTDMKNIKRTEKGKCTPYLQAEKTFEKYKF